MKYWILMGLLLFGCNRDFSNTSSDTSFAIYRLQDKSISASEVLDTPLAELELAEFPWLTAGDLSLYDISSHVMVLRHKQRSDFLGSPMDAPLSNKPFVVVAGGERLYMGYYCHPASSWAAMMPSINSVADFMFGPAIITINTWNSQDVDGRSDPRLVSALKSSGIYHGGIEVTLQKVEMISNQDPAVLQAHVTLVNRDSEALWVPNYEKMGTDTLVYFGNGVLLEQDNHRFMPRPEHTLEITDIWDFSDFVRLAPNERLQQTWEIDNYPSLKGEYMAGLWFSSPLPWKKTDVYKDGARIWLGTIESNRISVVVP